MQRSQHLRASGSQVSKESTSTPIKCIIHLTYFVLPPTQPPRSSLPEESSCETEFERTMVELIADSFVGGCDVIPSLLSSVNTQPRLMGFRTTCLPLIWPLLGSGRSVSHPNSTHVYRNVAAFQLKAIPQSNKLTGTYLCGIFVIPPPERMGPLPVRLPRPP